MSIHTFHKPLTSCGFLPSQYLFHLDNCASDVVELFGNIDSMLNRTGQATKIALRQILQWCGLGS